MNIKLLKNIGIEGKHTPAGTVVDVNLTLARELIGTGRAVRIDGEEEPTGGVISTENGLEPFPEGEAEPAKPAKPGKPAKPAKPE